VTAGPWCSDRLEAEDLALEVEGDTEGLEQVEAEEAVDVEAREVLEVLEVDGAAQQVVGGGLADLGKRPVNPPSLRRPSLAGYAPGGELWRGSESSRRSGRRGGGDWWSSGARAA
jgi:hypothetical protein